MKVAIIPSWYKSLDDNAGHFIDHQIKALAVRGINIFVFFPDLSINARGILPKLKYDVHEGIRRYEVSGFFPPRIFLALFDSWCHYASIYFERVIKMEGMPDILHAHGYIAGYLARHFARKFGIPYILTEHQGGFLEGGLIPARHNKLIRRSFQDARVTTAVSNVLANRLTHFTGIKNIRVFPNMVDTNIFYPRTRGSSNVFTFLAIGYNFPAKRFSLLIRSFAKVRNYLNADVRLRFVGEPEKMGDLKNLRDRLGLSNYIKFDGVYSAEEVATAIGNSHVLVSSSIRETFGLAIIEAMASGLPVVAVAAGGPQEILESKCGIIVDSDSEEALVQAMIEIYQHYDRYDPDEIRDYTDKNFGAAIFSEKWFGLYEEASKS